MSQKCRFPFYAILCPSPYKIPNFPYFPADLASSSYYAHNLRIFSVNILRALAHFLAPPKILADFRDVENVDTNHLPRWTGWCKFRVIFSSLIHSISFWHTHTIFAIFLCVKRLQECRKLIIWQYDGKMFRKSTGLRRSPTVKIS